MNTPTTDAGIPFVDGKCDGDLLDQLRSLMPLELRDQVQCVDFTSTPPSTPATHEAKL